MVAVSGSVGYLGFVAVIAVIVTIQENSCFLAVYDHVQCLGQEAAADHAGE